MAYVNAYAQELTEKCTPGPNTVTLCVGKQTISPAAEGISAIDQAILSSPRRATENS